MIFARGAELRRYTRSAFWRRRIGLHRRASLSAYDRRTLGRWYRDVGRKRALVLLISWWDLQPPWWLLRTPPPP